jgi:hypothetical protein
LKLFDSSTLYKSDNFEISLFVQLSKEKILSVGNFKDSLQAVEAWIDRHTDGHKHLVRCEIHSFTICTFTTKRIFLCFPGMDPEATASEEGEVLDPAPTNTGTWLKV